MFDSTTYIHQGQGYMFRLT